MPLQNAHSGYEYQDIFTALRFVDVLLSRTSQVTVDVKLFRGDVFDDLTTVWKDERRTREQLKHSVSPRTLEQSIFTSTVRDCRLDMLVASAIEDNKNNPSGAIANEYRLIMSDLEPTDSALIAILKHDTSLSSLQSGFTTKCYRLDINVLWPKTGTEESTPRAWQRVITEACEKGLTRADFEWFAQHFVLELETPKASFDLTKPGPAERLLLSRVTGEVGAEVYPNAERPAIDVAAALIMAAYAARSGSGDTTRNTLLRRATLRDDFGSVARAYPVETAKEIDVQRTANPFVHEANRALEAHVPLLVLGPPGQGKTWACDKLARNLQKDGWLVASHYCYLNFAEDESRDKRVQLDAIVGSLLAQVAAQEPLCVDGLQPRYAANSETLLRALKKARAKNPSRRIALVVDGLDHATRVRGTTTGRIDPATELAQELSLLDVPDGVVLIVACQRGAHDEPFRKAQAKIYNLPQWDEDNVRHLGEKLAVIGVLDEPVPNADNVALLISPTDPQLDGLVAELTAKSRGNALYATYCYRELRRAYEVTPQTTYDLIQTLRALPAFDGTMKAYYEYLLQAVPTEARIAANTLTLLEFAVTRDELKAMYPMIASFIDSMVDRLVPVLIERGLQGGIRVYHESFQRFILETHLENREQRQATLEPIIGWLRTKGFFKDARAFRFLAPLLAEIGDDKAVCGLVDIAYVAKAITAGHGEAAIVQNIAVAAEAAVRLQNWKALVSYMELAKEINTYASSRMDESIGSFSDIPIALYGAPWLADRLLFEGRPVFPARLGLRLCEAIDRAGGVPPWKEYLDAFKSSRANDTTLYSAEQERAIVLAHLRGTLRLSNNVNTAAFANWLVQDDLPCPSALVTIFLDIDQSGALALKIIRSLPKKRRSAYVFALAQQLPRLGTTHQLPSKGALLRRAMKLVLSSWDTLQALEMGVDPSLFRVDENELIAQTKIILNYDSQWTEAAVMKWMSLVFIAAHTNPTLLDRVILLVQGKGWYRCWLEYVVEIARFKASGTGSILPAFKLLTIETNPFTGKPRACDLFRIRSLIRETLRLGLKHVADTDWSVVLRIFQEVSDNTTVSLQNSLSGPLSTELLLELAIDFTTPSRWSDTSNFIEEYFKDAAASRTYYDTIAQYYLLRARLSVAIGDTSQAETYWAYTAHLNACYGHHKDITIYELLDSIPELIKRDGVKARERLVRLKLLVRRVLRHTDHKETRHALLTWWSLVAKADGIGTGMLIAEQMLDTPNHQAEELHDAQFKLHLEQGGKMSLPVRFASRLSLGYQSASGDDDAELLRLLKATPLDNLPDELAADSITSLFQDRVTDNHDDEVDIKGFRQLASGALELNGYTLEVPTTSGSQQREEYALPVRVEAQINSQVGIEWGDTPIDIARAIRQWSQRSYGLDSGEAFQNRSLNATIEALGWRLLTLCEEGNSETAENLLRFLGEHVSYSNAKPVMQSLAQGLVRFGLTRLAVIAYVFAYTQSKGGGGWLTFGGKEHEESLQAAVALDAKLALSELGMAIVHVLNGKYYGVQGISQALVQAFCSDVIGADVSTTPFEVWDAAADVIADRLPPLGEDDEDDVPYIPTTSNNETIQELESAIAATVVSNVAHPEKPLKRGALLGTAWLLQLAPSTAIKGLRLALKRNLDPAGKTWLLWLLLQFETAPYPITQGCLEELTDLAQSSLLTVRSLAGQILTRASIIAPPPPATSVKIVGIPLSNEQQKRNYTLAIEELEQCASERVALAEEFMPQLGVAASLMLGRLFNDEEFQHSYSSQMKGLTHPSSQRQPDAYTLKQEAVERILQEVAAGARVAQAKEDGIVRNPQEFEKELAEALIDNPELPLRVAASRVPRPNPHTILEAEHTTATLPTVEQGPYKGWCILGAYERRIILGDRYKKITGKTVLITGGAEVSAASASHNHPIPFGFGSTLRWLETMEESPPSISPRKNLKGPLIGVETDTVPKYFGLGIPQMVLVPHPALIRILNLRNGPILNGLTLLDGKGNKAIVARTWRTKFVRGDDFGPPYPLIVGMDVLMRPDLLEILEQQFSPNSVRFCSRHTESADDEND